MTSGKQLKARVRARMARTGERYAVARAHVLGAAAGGAPVVDAGWTLRGGTDPDTAALANVLAHRGVAGPAGPLTEPLLFVVGGGPGAGYILWEFDAQDGRVVTLGFTHSWQYFDRRLATTVDRLGLDARWSRTGGAVGAARALASALDAGDPAIVWPDRHQVGYWHLPAFLDGGGGHPVVAYAASGTGPGRRVHVDDRTLAPLTVPAGDLDRARARVGSYRNAMLVVGSIGTAVPADRLREAVLTGLRATVDQLGGTSTSFALPAWRKWSRLLVDPRAAKGWPTVFADGRGLLRALAGVWEAVEPAGTDGGHLRGLFADGLEKAAAVVEEPALAAEAPRWREIADRWHTLADTALPDDVPAVARLRELTATVTGAVAEGDAGAADRAAAAEELWRLRAEHADAPPLDGARLTAVLADLSEQLAAVHDAERAAVDRLGAVLAG
ncbi:BtrH N-terminal domain-containing protein [Modestobacter marinus]|uniref:BtrH N-terminal domain-containing protein n=1 Tax=Modestobacter marinus TaxID=477641 RepID=UPI001C97FACB|nr:BtrH N-terminal domain-containing protein [Modestobacter marinus]